MIKPHRNQPLWFAYLLHRVSGILLALFLPVHLYLLGLALHAETGQFENALTWTAQPLVKVAEVGLVFLLAVHMFGGLRLLALEFLPWSDRQKRYAAISITTALFSALLFLLRAV